MKKIKKLKVRVIPNSSQDKVSIRDDGVVKVKTQSAPERNRANQRVKELLADKYQTRPSKVIIVKGQTDTSKIIKITK